MARALISAENGLLRNVVGIAVAMLVIPLAITAALIAAPFARPMCRSPEEVLSYLRQFRDGTGDPYDWDDFTSVPLADPELEELRMNSESLNLPFGEKESAVLTALITRAELLAERRRSS